MSLIIPEIDGSISKIVIYPKIISVEIIDIHRVMIKDFDRVLPITIINAKTPKLKLLRDISIILAKKYLDKKDKESYIIKYFKITKKQYDKIVKDTTYKYPKRISYWEYRLQLSTQITIAYDIQKQCELTNSRLKELVDFELLIKTAQKNPKALFSPSYIMA